jgi:hypothetical protein
MVAQLLASEDKTKQYNFETMKKQIFERII